jgi:hypothetical protein
VLTADLRARLAAEKVALLTALRDPKRAAREAWETALREVADTWDAHAGCSRAHGLEPCWRDDEAETAAIRNLTLAGDLPGSLTAVASWRDAWTAAMAAPQAPVGPSPAQGPLPIGFLERARQLPARDLASWLDGDDPARREAAAAELRIRGNLIADEAEGKRSAPNESVVNMFSPAAKKTPWYRP